MNVVDKRAAEPRAALRKRIDRLNHPSIGGPIQCVDPFAHLVNDIDVPLGTSHTASLAIPIPQG
jgi:hypothetical protein